MAKFFISIYLYLEKHPATMWCSLIITTFIFVFFAFKLPYEEDILKILPKTEQSEKGILAFEQMSIKDKIFLEMAAKDGQAVSPEELAEAHDDFIQQLLRNDSSNHYISNILYRMEDDWTINGLDYLLNHFPSLVDTSVYAHFDSLLTPEAIDRQMEENYALMANDATGEVTSLLCYDPVGLRQAIVGQLGDISSSVGFSIVHQHLFSTDSTVALAFITPSFNYLDSKICFYLGKEIQNTVEEFSETHPNIDILYHGNSILSSGNSSQVKKDLFVTLGISLCLILIVILICYRNKSTVVLLLFPMVYGLMFALACMYWFRGSMSMMAIGVGTVVMGIAMSYVMHILTHYKYVSSPITVLREQSTPVCLSCLTTIGAFAGLYFTNSNLLKDFGLFATFALIGTTLCGLIFMPQFFLKNRNLHNKRAFAFLEKVNSISLDHSLVAIVLIIIVSVVCFFASRKVQFDNDLNNIGYISEEVSRSQQLFNDKFNHGYQSVFYAASASTMDSALYYNQYISNCLNTLKKQGVVQQYSNVSQLFAPIGKQEENIAGWKSYWTPQRISETRQNISRAAQKNGLEADIFDPFFALLEADYEAESLYDSGVIPVEISSNFVEKVGDNYLVFSSVLTETENIGQINDAVSAQPHAIVTDPFYYTGGMISLIHENFNIVLFISSIFVLIVLLISYRSIILALLAFLPMFLSWYIVQGSMALLGLQFNLINIIVASIIFGVGVDYSIFIMSGLIATLQGQNNQVLIYHKTAISFSAFILIVVLVSLLFAKHPAVYSVGICTLIGMMANILISYSLQPFLFRQLIKIDYIRKKALKLDVRK